MQQVEHLKPKKKNKYNFLIAFDQKGLCKKYINKLMKCKSKSRWHIQVHIIIHIYN